MTQRTIRLEVEAKVKAWAAAQSPAIPIAYENVAFTKPDTTFIELYIIPATTVNQTVSAARKTLTGLIQFNIYTKEGVGTKKSEEIAQALIDLFPVVPKAGTVSIEQTGSIMNTLYQAQWLVTPVRFRYRQENY
jgi:hypothetical protein